MPEVNPRATDPYHNQPGPRRAYAQQPTKPISPAEGDHPPGSAEPNTTPHHCGEPVTPAAEPATNRPRGKRTQRNAVRRGTKPRATSSPPPDSLSDEQRVRRARLAAMAEPRPTDSPAAAGLRQVLRDEALMAQVIATVDGWQPLTDEQRETIGALLNPLRPSG